ncbi:MAG: crossover junction endodeoxyribonuclease RuvC [Synergistales bacterium]|nr:crossover junction endodeoxyribonuclease RuvC [Bacteroidales bacterium]MDY6394532.1 crossover junction endodeoxyribonuclease RuvC [Bacteroidales bacterium]MDY6402497.1 crossover junction endodeoxyribonuclease RuvC [Bacteroidales bacterium]MDY6424405.1 crossover junction endodeoxyribonuclease RuvC [Bacteroidales bacterium]MDY6435742.1 crossover junction endodeoxyribonuclease RuvC [Synergistales bacterium]
MEKEEIVLGIDPGTNVMGYSFVKKIGKNIEVLEMDILKLGNKEEMSTRMKIIFDFIIKKIDIFHPDMLALEAPFYYKNVQSMLKLGRVQGICIAAGLSRDIPFTEFPPKRVKQSITGNGNASKEQVMKMLQMMKLIDENPKYLDASDALAVAVCYCTQSNLMETGVNAKITKPKTKTLSWAAYINEHQNRVIK